MTLPPISLFLSPITTTNLLLTLLLLTFLHQFLLPSSPHTSKQVHRRPRILHGTMGGTLHLDPLPQLLVHQISQLPRTQLAATSPGGTHEGFVSGSIPNIFPRMGEHQCRQIVFKGVSHEDLIVKELSHFGTAFIVFECRFVPCMNVFGTYARHGRTEIGNAFGNTNVHVEENGAVPIYHGSASQGGLFAINSNTHHFAIDGDVLLCFGRREGSVGRSLFGAFGSAFLFFGVLGKEVVDAGKGLFCLLLLMFVFVIAIAIAIIVVNFFGW
mmetsp:Transcript_23263/g.39769  ORF Transcript_23263/g.39769 Transcript_23263/m.39769 type:complete len:270 (+) Transcript_23263:144-953(+)